MEKKIQTAIFSGSFNPIHIGHLVLANWICENTDIDQLWFMVTPHNPLKQKKDLINDDVRLKWVQDSIAGYDKFKASDFEFSLPQPSYTIDTLRALEEQYPEREFTLVMGADNWTQIKNWKEWENLIKKYNVLIYPRLGFELHIPSEYKKVKKTEAPVIEISSSFIRESLKKNKDIRFFLPEPIRNDFYQFNRNLTL